jgi:1-acyl-sn-glycerol-3-phosphate acyltransferase
MVLIRSLIFAAAFYAWSTLISLLMLPLLLAPWRWMSAGMEIWTRGVIGLLLWICDIRVEFRGLEHLPVGRALIAAKHNCMFDTMGPLVVIKDACYVMKLELTRIPFYGWFSAKTKMIVVDREGQASALRGLLKDAKARVAEGRPIVIFPEGSRTAPGERRDYQPGVAGLYRTLGLPCIPMATNSGAHWPAHGFLRTPGTIVFEFLPAIPPGLSREDFMAELTFRLEKASALLLTE